MELAERILGEIEQLDDYAPELILDSIKTLCLGELGNGPEMLSTEDVAREKLWELYLAIVPEAYAHGLRINAETSEDAMAAALVFLDRWRAESPVDSAPQEPAP
jgi:hypothetical protein